MNDQLVRNPYSKLKFLIFFLILLRYHEKIIQMNFSSSPTSLQQQQLDIPQFVVIHDQIDNTYKHPIIHYVFEDEKFPDVPKDDLILVDLDATASQLVSVDSYSPHFQVTDCILEQSQLGDQFEEDASLLNLTIEGVSAPKL